MTKSEWLSKGIDASLWTVGPVWVWWCGRQLKKLEDNPGVIKAFATGTVTRLLTSSWFMPVILAAMGVWNIWEQLDHPVAVVTPKVVLRISISVAEIAIAAAAYVILSLIKLLGALTRATAQTFREFGEAIKLND